MLSQYDPDRAGAILRDETAPPPFPGFDRAAWDALKDCWGRSGSGELIVAGERAQEPIRCFRRLAPFEFFRSGSREEYETPLSGVILADSCWQSASNISASTRCSILHGRFSEESGWGSCASSRSAGCEYPVVGLAALTGTHLRAGPFARR